MLYLFKIFVGVQNISYAYNFFVHTRRQADKLGIKLGITLKNKERGVMGLGVRKKMRKIGMPI